MMYQERIRSLYQQFSPGYRRIANYLLNHYQDAAFLTAAEIARIAEVDTALVVRFAQRLGYPGFPELLSDLQEEVKRDLRAVYEPVESGNTPEQVLRRSLLQDRNNLDYMLQHLDDAGLAQVVQHLDEAKRVFVIGEGALSHLAEAFVVRLLALDYAANAVSDEFTGQAAITAAAKPGDLFVGLSYAGASLVVATLLKGARVLGARTIAIVSSLTNPAATAAELILHVPADTVGFMPSWTNMAAVLNALTLVLALLRGDQAANHIQRTEDLLNMYCDALRVAKPLNLQQMLKTSLN